jgi:hypothetical protein
MAMYALTMITLVAVEFDAPESPPFDPQRMNQFSNVLVTGKWGELDARVIVTCAILWPIL